MKKFVVKGIRKIEQVIWFFYQTIPVICYHLCDVYAGNLMIYTVFDNCKVLKNKDIVSLSL